MHDQNESERKETNKLTRTREKRKAIKGDQGMRTAKERERNNQKKKTIEIRLKSRKAKTQEEKRIPANYKNSDQNQNPTRTEEDNKPIRLNRSIKLSTNSSRTSHFLLNVVKSEHLSSSRVQVLVLAHLSMLRHKDSAVAVLNLNELIGVVLAKRGRSGVVDDGLVC